MGKYVLKQEAPPEVDAVQFTGDLNSAVAVAELYSAYKHYAVESIELAKRFSEGVYQKTLRIVLSSATASPVFMWQSDWIVITDNSVSILTDEEFKNRWVPVNVMPIVISVPPHPVYPSTVWNSDKPTLKRDVWRD